MKIGVIGCGAFGFAIAHRLASSDTNEVVVWAESEAKVDEFNEKGSLACVLDSHPLPRNVLLTTSMEESVAEKDMVIVLTTAQFVPSVCEAMKPFLGEETKVAVGAKGLCPNGDLPADAAMRILERGVSMFAGPGFAVDIMDDVPVGITFATEDDEAYELALKAFAHDTRFKLDRSRDVIGVDLCSCIKNAAAIACGALEGSGNPISTQCLLVQRILTEVAAMLEALPGGSADTAMSLAGMGDTVLTCFSPKSRNCSFGMLVGKHGFSSPEAQGYLASTTVEGMSVVESWGVTSAALGIESRYMDVAAKVFAEDGDMSLLLDYLTA